jgi:hypothetical protein
MLALLTMLLHSQRLQAEIAAKVKAIESVVAGVSPQTLFLFSRQFFVISLCGAVEIGNMSRKL